MSRTWKRDLARYLAIDRRRSLGRIASVVLPYTGVWVMAAIAEPPRWLAIALGLVATVFLVRMYSFFHDLDAQLDVRVAQGDTPTSAGRARSTR